MSNSFHASFGNTGFAFPRCILHGKGDDPHSKGSLRCCVFAISTLSYFLERDKETHGTLRDGSRFESVRNLRFAPNKPPFHRLVLSFLMELHFLAGRGGASQWPFATFRLSGTLNSISSLLCTTFSCRLHARPTGGVGMDMPWHPLHVQTHLGNVGKALAHVP